MSCSGWLSVSEIANIWQALRSMTKPGRRMAVTPGLKELLDTEPTTVVKAIADNLGAGEFTRIGNASIHIDAWPLHDREDQVIGGLAIVRDTGYIAAQTRRVWRDVLPRVAEMVLIALVTLLIVRWSLSGPIARAAQWMRALRTGRAWHAIRPFQTGTFFSPGAGSGDIRREPEACTLGRRN